MRPRLLRLGVVTPGGGPQGGFPPPPAAAHGEGFREGKCRYKRGKLYTGRIRSHTPLPATQVGGFRRLAPHAADLIDFNGKNRDVDVFVVF